MTQDLQKTIEDAWKNRINLTALSSSAEIREAINEVIRRLGEGILRVAEKKDGEWIVNQWAKRAVLLSFRMEEKTAGNVAARASAAFAPGTSRLAPMAIARHGSFIGKDVVIMPSFINVGAYVDEGVMIDAWVTVGSCAQIGKQVHLSGSVGIGGILEPMQVNPTIIEDNCFIGTRAEIADGVVVEENSIISAGVCIDRSTRIYDRQNDRILYGRVPSGSIVVPGSLPSPDGKYSLHCAIIMKRVDAKTRAKTAVHQLLREAESL